MSIHFRIIKSRKLALASGYQIRPVYKDYIDEEYLARSISESSSFTPGDILGVIDAICHELSTAIYRGKLIRLKKLGTIKATLGYKNKDMGEDPETRYVYLKGLNLVWSREFKNKVMDTKFAMAPEYRDILCRSETVRIENIIKTARESGLVYTRDMASLNSCSFRTATKDMSKLYKDGTLERLMKGLYKLSDK